jgi:hypothetical protein
LVQQAAALWRQAALAADAAALFSPNEELEDLATADIKYLLIPFYHAEALSATHSGAICCGWTWLKAACALNALPLALQKTPACALLR